VALRVARLRWGGEIERGQVIVKKTAKSKKATVVRKPATKKAAARKAAAAPRAQSGKPRGMKGGSRMVAKKPTKVTARRADEGASKFTPTKRKLTAAEIKEFKGLLMRLRDRLSGQITSLKSDSLKRNDEVNTVEDGTDAFERQFALNIASSENDALFEIDEALRRIESHTFGICEMSGEPIEFERLKAIPYTRYSVAAQAEMEKGKAPYRQSSVLRAL